MTIRGRLCPLVRWLFRQPDPASPPGTGQRYQDAERAAARQRLLDLAAQLGRPEGNREPAQDAAEQR